MQLGVWGRLEPPSGSRAQSPGGVHGAKPPEALKIPHSIVSKILGQNSQINSKGKFIRLTQLADENR